MQASRLFSFVIILTCFGALGHRMPTADDHFREALAEAHARTTGGYWDRSRSRQSSFIIRADQIHVVEGETREFRFGESKFKILTEPASERRFSSTLRVAREMGEFIIITIPDDNNRLAYGRRGEHDWELTNPQKVGITVIAHAEQVLLKRAWPGGPYRVLDAWHRPIRLFDSERAYLDKLIASQPDESLLCPKLLLTAQRNEIALEGRCFVVGQFALAPLRHPERDPALQVTKEDEDDALAALLWEAIGQRYEPGEVEKVEFGDLTVLPPISGTKDAPLSQWILPALRDATQGKREFDIVAPIRLDCGEWILARFERRFSWRHPIVGELIVTYYLPLHCPDTRDVEAGIFAALNWKEHYAFRPEVKALVPLPDPRWPGLEIARQLRAIVGQRNVRPLNPNVNVANNNNVNNNNNNNNNDVVNNAVRVPFAGSF